jgi:hypothetical protein
MIRRAAITLIISLLVFACGGEDQESSETVDGITARQVEGVWVFSHSPTGGMDALHGGRVTVEGDCLLVDGAVVVFHDDMMQDGIELIGATRDGDELTATIPGGGISLSEGAALDDIPQVIADRCDVDTVWFGAEGALEIGG